LRIHTKERKTYMEYIQGRQNKSKQKKRKRKTCMQVYWYVLSNGIYCNIEIFLVVVIEL